MELAKEAYLKDPCATSSLPYWKAIRLTVPGSMKILHDDVFQISYLEQYTDDPFFRIQHDLVNLPPAVLPKGFILCDLSLAGYAAHINRCYPNTSINETEIIGYTLHPTYTADLWVAVKDENSGEIAATGIAELDTELGEGILEWIQVSEEYRRCGLGTYVVSEILHRLAGRAQFATVSGQSENPSNPEALYRKCGFFGKDLWHILVKK